MRHNHLTPTRLGLVIAVAVGAVLGSVFGQPGSGVAASTTVPKNTSPPTITGSASVASTLTASPGKWSGSPTSFSYQWKRCDTGGNSCAAIGHATAKQYTVTAADEGATLRVTVKATNASGSGFASSAPTAPVPSPGCPAGTGTVQVSQLFPPARLLVSPGTVSPSVVTPSASAIKLHFTVTACGGRQVQGATVYATAIPFNQFAAATGTTASDGTVTLDETKLRGFPVSSHQHLLAVFVRAVKQGDPLLGGVSTRILVSFPVRR